MALARIDTPDAAAAIAALLSKRISPALVEAAVASADTRVSGSLLTWLNRNPTDVQVRLALVRALGILAKQTMPGLVATLRSQLEYPDPNVRVAAAEALARLRAEAAADDLRACRWDFDGAVRRACKQAVRRLARTQQGWMPKMPRAF